MKRGGFTLVELLVASVLMTIVLSGVYAMFSGVFNAWRGAEDNVHAYRDARVALGLMQREMAAIAPGTSHLVQGERDSLSFVALTEPMEPSLGEAPRLLWITYALERGRRNDPLSLVREEALVTGPIPPASLNPDGRFALQLDVAPSERFVLARDVQGIAFEYRWVDSLAQPVPGQLLEPMIFDRSIYRWPNAIQIELTLAPEQNLQGTRAPLTFETIFAYRGLASAPPDRNAAI